MQTLEDQNEYDEGFRTGNELSNFSPTTIQTGIENLDFSAPFLAGLWDARLHEEREMEADFYEQLRLDTIEYQREQRLSELNALSNGRSVAYERE